MSPEMQESWAPFNAERSSIFEWFSSVYADVISKDLFEFYCSDDMAQLMDFFVGLGFNDEVARVVKAINAMDGSEESWVALAEDFKTLFLTKQTRTAPPLSSRYLEQEDLSFLHSNPPISLFLRNYKLPLNPEFGEVDDHISVYLAAISAWCLVAVDEKDPDAMDSIAQIQGMFLEAAFLTWLEDWQRDLEAIEGTNYDFYQSLSALMAAFIEIDALALCYEPNEDEDGLEIDWGDENPTVH